MSGRTIKLGQYWGYTKKLCNDCKHLETSKPINNDINNVLVACCAPDGICIKDNHVVYIELNINF